MVDGEKEYTGPLRRSTRIRSQSRGRSDISPATTTSVSSVSPMKLSSPIKTIKKNETTPTTSIDPTKILDANGVPLGSDHAPGVNKCKSFFQRLWTSLFMFALFCGAIHLGHPAILAIIIVVQFLMYREIVKLAYTHLLTKEESHNIPLFRTQNYLWFFSTLFYMYGSLMNNILQYSIPYHSFISFSLLSVCFVSFVLSLRKGLYRVQFSMFAWVLLALIIVVLQSTLLIYNMFSGLFWFVLPAILVMSNDTWAYVWGQLLGRTPLLEISPKKTWEGFFGAFVTTSITSFFIARAMSYFPILICPQNVLTFTHPSCEVPDTFILTTYEFASTIPILGWNHITYSDAQLHAVFMSVFASLVAPFGGFFASGFKRAFKIKDFGDLIPGHGGLTDRMDCQLLMGMFVFVYYHTFVNPSQVAVNCATTCATSCVAQVAEVVDVDSLFKLASQLSVVDRSKLAKMLVARV